MKFAGSNLTIVLSSDANLNLYSPVVGALNAPTYVSTNSLLSILSSGTNLTLTTGVPFLGI